MSVHYPCKVPVKVIYLSEGIPFMSWKQLYLLQRICPAHLRFLAAIGVAIPTAARIMMDPNDPRTDEKILMISRGAAIILFFW